MIESQVTQIGVENVDLATGEVLGPAEIAVRPVERVIAARPPAHETRMHQQASVNTTAEYTPFACSESIANLVEALAKAGAEFDEVVRNKRADVTSRREGARSYSYKYADLDAVISATRPALSANGLTIIQAPVVRANIVTVVTLLVHSSGEWIRNDLAMKVDSLDPQAIGSAITYARRYAQLPLLNLAPSEDDDAGGHRRPESSQRAQEPARREKPPVEASVSEPAKRETWERREGESQADYIARVKASQAAKGASTEPVAPFHKYQEPAVEPPSEGPQPSTEPTTQTDQGDVEVTAAVAVKVVSVTPRKASAVIDGKQTPLTVYVVRFAEKVAASDGKLVSEGATSKDEIGYAANAAKANDTLVRPVLVPGQRGMYALKSL